MTSQPNIVKIPEEFKDIAPYTEAEFKQKIEQLVKEPGFEQAVKFIMPDVDFNTFARDLLNAGSQKVFQREVMRNVLEYLEQSSTDGISVDGVENISLNTCYTFITNHRDIVLDASFLNLCFIRLDMPVTQVAIGNNLLIYEWISDLVKLNRSFIVKRDAKMKEALDAAKQLSAYIHFTINQLHESVWIAQREGRAKDSNDLTQESLIKMLSLAGGGTTKENILGVNLCPVSISYEFDPNDYLKAREYLYKRRDPQYKKSKQDDLLSMDVGIRKKKGRIMFRIGKCINDQLKDFSSDNRIEVIRHTCQLIDRSIHCGYELYPCNYISSDLLEGSRRFADHYTAEDEKIFDDYMNHQLDKSHVDDITPEEREFMRQMMLTMYANPLKNKLMNKCVRAL